MMKKKWLSLTSAILLSMLTACGSNPSTTATAPASPETQSSQSEAPEKKTLKIGISQIVEHPALDQARKGVLQALKEGGYDEGKNLDVDVQFAQGDMNNNITIAQKFVSDQVDLIVAISTPSAQAAVQASKDIPVIFSMISDPVGAKLVKSLDQPGGNATGTSSTHPEAIKWTMESIVKYVPDAKTVGIIYNGGEQNSLVSVKEAKEVLAGLGLEAKEVTVSTSTEVKAAAESLIGKAQAIWFPQDNTVTSSMESIVKVANEHDIPLFVPDSTAVKRGGFSTFSFDYFEVGRTTGKVALEVLNGKSPADVPVSYPEKLKLVLNESAAKEQGIALTDELKQGAEMTASEK